MGAYIIRRLLLIFPTLLGILIINFTLVQFVPGGPVEQILAQIEGEGDVFEAFSGGSREVAITTMDPTQELGVCLMILLKSLRRSSVLISHQSSAF